MNSSFRAPQVSEAGAARTVASLEALPFELLTEIANYQSLLLDLANLALVSRRCYEVVNPLLYRKECELADWPPNFASAIHWAAWSGNLGTIEKVLAAGGDVNKTCHGVRLSDRSFWWTSLGRRRLRPDSIDSGRSHDSSVPPMESDRANGFQGNGTFTVGNEDDDVELEDEGTPEEAHIADDDDGSADEGEREDSVSDYHFEDWRSCVWSPLHVAVHAVENGPEIIDLLLRNGADINNLSLGACDCELTNPFIHSETSEPHSAACWTPLHVAICSKGDNCHKAAKKLMAAGADTVVGPKEGLTALHCAAKFQRIELADYILKSGFQRDIDVRDSSGRTPFLISAAIGGMRYEWRHMCDWLLDHGANINARGSDGATMLLWACRSRDWTVACTLLDRGADPNARDSTVTESVALAAATPLEACAMSAKEVHGDLDSQILLVRKLIAKGAHVDAGRYLDPERRIGARPTPLMVASYSRSLHVMRVLVEAGSDVNAVSAVNPPLIGMVPLTFVFLSGEHDRTYDAFKILVEAGAVLTSALTLEKLCNARHMETSLKLSMARTLLEGCLDPTTVLANFNPPLHSWPDSADYELLRLFLDKGVRLSQSGYDNWLRRSVGANQADGLDMLLTLDFEKLGLQRPEESDIEELVDHGLIQGAHNALRRLFEEDFHVTGPSLLIRAAIMPGGGAAIQSLLRHGAQIDARSDDQTITALGAALTAALLDNVGILVRCGADVFIDAILNPALYHPTGLHHAGPRSALGLVVEQRDFYGTKALLGQSLTPFRGQSPERHRQYWDLLIAKEIRSVKRMRVAPDPEITELLLGAGLDPNMELYEGRTPVTQWLKTLVEERGECWHSTEDALYNLIGVLKEVMRAGYDIEKRDGEGRAAIDYLRDIAKYQGSVPSLQFQAKAVRINRAAFGADFASRVAREDVG